MGKASARVSVTSAAERAANPRNTSHGRSLRETKTGAKISAMLWTNRAENQSAKDWVDLSGSNAPPNESKWIVSMAPTNR